MATVTPGAMLQHVRPGCDDRWDAPGLGQDRAVAGRAAAGQDDAEHMAEVEVGDLGRREVVGHEHPVGVDVLLTAADEGSGDLGADAHGRRPRGPGGTGPRARRTSRASASCRIHPGARRAQPGVETGAYCRRAGRGRRAAAGGRRRRRPRPRPTAPQRWHGPRWISSRTRATASSRRACSGSGPRPASSGTTTGGRSQRPRRADRDARRCRERPGRRSSWR